MTPLLLHPVLQHPIKVTMNATQEQMLTGKNELLLIRDGLLASILWQFSLRGGQAGDHQQKKTICSSVGFIKHWAASFDESVGCLMRLLLNHSHTAGCEPDCAASDRTASHLDLVVMLLEDSALSGGEHGVRKVHPGLPAQLQRHTLHAKPAVNVLLI